MTNEVVEATTNVACAAQSVGDKLTSTMGKQAAEGHAFLKQALAWLTENGLDFAVNVLAGLWVRPANAAQACSLQERLRSSPI